MKKHTVIISESALKDMYNILNYCNLTYTLSYSLKLYSLLIKNIYSLSIFPNSNPLYSATNTTFSEKE